MEWYEGFVTLFKDKEGYGFIRCSEIGEDIFVHYEDIVGVGFRTLVVGQKVKFQIKERNKGIGAINVEAVVPDSEK